MKRGVYFIFCMLMILLLILSGCAGNHEILASSEMQSVNAAGSEETKAVPESDTDNTPILKKTDYEYEIQELYGTDTHREEQLREGHDAAEASFLCGGDDKGI